MTQQYPLSGLSVLVMEDDYLQAEDARMALEKAGARVIGPFANADKSEASLKSEQVDCALLDINLGAGPNFQAAQAAHDRGLPFLFVTGYDEEAIPERFREIERLQKPISGRMIVAAIARLCGRER